MRKKILITAPRISGRGGTETVIRQWLDSSLSDEYDITLFVARMTNDEWLRGISPSIQIINGGINKITIIVNYIQILLNGHFDIIVDTNTKTLKIDFMIRHLFKRNYKIISWLHFSLNHVQSININNLKYADQHLAISSGIANQFKQITPNIPVELIYNPIEKSSQSIKFCKEGPLQLVYIGRVEWEHQKNLSLLFEGLSHISPNQYCLHLYGDGKDLSHCKEKAKQLGLNVQFYGWNSNPWQSIGYPIDCLVLSSNFEGFPMVIGEALSRGVPVVSTDCPTGPADMIKIGENGYLYSIGNVNQLVTILEKLSIERLAWDHEQIRNSIETFYSQSYFANVRKILEGE